MSLNGYSYVEGNTPNRTDPSGKCWDNPGTPSNQQSQCLEAWVNYASGIDLDDPTYRELLRQEDAYWRGLPYQDFTRLWNDNRARPPLSMKTRSNNAGNIMSSAVGVAGTVSFVNPLPGPEDAVAGGILVGGACLAAGAALVGGITGGGSIALPLRQPMDFSRADDDVIDVPITRTFPDNYTDDEVVPLFHYGTASKISFILTTQTIPYSDFDANPQRARYGSGVYFTDIVPGTMSKGQISRQIYLAPFYTKDVEAWVMVNLNGLVVIPERLHVFLVPTTAVLPVSGRILATGLTPEPPRNPNP